MNKPPNQFPIPFEQNHEIVFLAQSPVKLQMEIRPPRNRDLLRKESLVPDLLDLDLGVFVRVLVLARLGNLTSLVVNMVDCLSSVHGVSDEHSNSSEL